ncbi:MAG: HEPN domain-containing protein [Clostridia bacterium]|nr:HEPN domain-containing protein [Clostridia bacterium]
MNLTMSLIKADIVAAKQAIDYYEKSNLKDIKNVAAYHLQQATEKLIKIQIYSKADDLNYSNLYTHNIEKLLAYSEKLNISICIPKYIDDNSLVLTEWEAGSRYNVGFQIRINVLKKTLDEVEKWYEEVYNTGLREA